MKRWKEILEVLLLLGQVAKEYLYLADWVRGKKIEAKPEKKEEER